MKFFVCELLLLCSTKKSCFESTVTLLLASWAWLSPEASGEAFCWAAVFQAWSPSRGSAVTLLLHFLRHGTDNYTSMCKGRLNLTCVWELESKVLDRRQIPLRSSGPWMERPHHPQGNSVSSSSGSGSDQIFLQDVLSQEVSCETSLRSGRTL